MINISQQGDFSHIEKFLKSMSNGSIYQALEQYGRAGVSALSSATPYRTGITARSWTYEIKKTKSSYKITWSNTNVVDGRPIAVLLQYGHGTRNGGFVRGRDYINPAIQPIFDEIAEAAWKVVTSA